MVRACGQKRTYLRDGFDTSMRGFQVFAQCETLDFRELDLGART